MIYPTPSEENIIKEILKNNFFNCLDKLKVYVSLLLEENTKHNLIGKNTIDNIWSRHIIDSLQLLQFITNYSSNNIVDLGSGAGLPGVVLGIATNKKITFIEKSPVKCEFLKKICNKLGLEYCIFNHKIDVSSISNIIDNNTIITSRAFKSISEIFFLVNNVSNKIDSILLLKGQKLFLEIDECKKQNNNLLLSWNFNVVKSILGDGYVIEFYHKL